MASEPGKPSQRCSRECLLGTRQGPLRGVEVGLRPSVPIVTVGMSQGLIKVNGW